ncbi:MAG TPA: RagB/SusD family nutrient uptake outer membrane protein, partial [Parasegetibacter sp.]
DNMTAIYGGSTAISLKAQKAEFAYKWAQDIEDLTGTFTDNFFRTMYKGILVANTCLEAVDGAEGTEAEKRILKGQAYFTRAYSYFVLANFYAQAYNEASPDDPGVPMILATTPSLNGYNRGTIKEVWDVITSDIESAISFLKTDTQNRSFYEINYKAALLLATRIYLYMENYDKVIDYGEEFLTLNPALKDMSNTTTLISPSAATQAFMYPFTNPEVVFTFGRISSAAAEGTYQYITYEAALLAHMVLSASYDVPGDLISTYEANDRRLPHWFYPPQGGFIAYPSYTPMKLNPRDGTQTSQFFRSAEVYLNLAEAYARKTSPDNAKTISYLNQLRSKRIGSYVNLTSGDFANQQALIRFVWEERRRELCFEEFHRWWDLRRTGQPRLEHKWNTETYVLQEKDPAYILNFPREELEFNPELVPNLRPQRNP